MKNNKKTWLFTTNESHITFSSQTIFNKICQVYNIKYKKDIWKKLNLLDINDCLINDAYKTYKIIRIS